MPLNILYFFNLLIVCSITILFLACYRLYSFSSCDCSKLLFFLFGNEDIVVLASPSPLLNIQDQTHLEYVIELQMISLYKYYSHVSSSFLTPYFMNYNSMIVNHKLILYSMSFLLVHIVCITSFLIHMF